MMPQLAIVSVLSREAGDPNQPESLIVIKRGNEEQHRMPVDCNFQEADRTLLLINLVGLGIRSP
jgi:hypothetical protein